MIRGFWRNLSEMVSSQPSANVAFSQALHSSNIVEARRLLKSGAIRSASYEDLLQSVRLGDLEILNTLLTFRAIKAVIAANNYRALELAVERGHLGVVNRLLEFPAVVARITAQNNWALRWAAQKGHLDVVNRLLEFPAVVARITARNNGAFIWAAQDGRLDVVNRLLEFPAVLADITADNNATLRYAARDGRIDVVNRLLEFPAVVADITANNNEALRFALHNERHEIVARLLEFPAVVAYEAAHPDPMAAGVGLAAVAQDNESSIRALSSAEKEELSTLKERYASQFQEQGLEAILSDLRKHLVARYQANPAQYNGTALPLQYHGQLEKEANAQYYQNPYHTAYRYLFCQPNPWMDPAAVWVNRNAQGAHANISDASKEYIAYLWLAASEVLPLSSGYTREDIQNRFIDLLADAGRGHNWDKKRKKIITKNQERVEIEEHYDDGEGDKPSCSLGVTRRTVAQFLVLLQPNVKPLNKEAIHAQFTENLVTQNSQKNGLFDKIMSLDLNTLTALNSALDNLVGVAATKIEYLNEEEQALLREVLSVDAGALKSFMAQCQQDFGERLSAKVTLTWEGEKFDSYEKLIQYFAQNTFTIFYTALKTKCESQLRTLTPSQPVTPVALRTPAPLALSATSSTLSSSSATVQAQEEHTDLASDESEQRTLLVASRRLPRSMDVTMSSSAKGPTARIRARHYVVQDLLGSMDVTMSSSAEGPAARIRARH